MIALASEKSNSLNSSERLSFSRQRLNEYLSLSPFPLIDDAKI